MIVVFGFLVTNWLRLLKRFVCRENERDRRGVGEGAHAGP